MNAEEKKAFREMSFKKKLSHIFYYYKWHIIIAVALLIFLTSIIHGAVTRKKNIFEMVMINSNVTALDEPEIMSDFEKTQKDFDPKKEQMSAEYLEFDINSQDQTTLAIEQKLYAMIAAEGVDCMIAPRDVTDKYASVGAFADLNELLPEEFLEYLDETGCKSYYYDMTDEETNSITHVLIGIEISDAPVIKSGFTSNTGQTIPFFDRKPSSPLVYSVIINSNNKNRAVDFLSYLTVR